MSEMKSNVTFIKKPELFAQLKKQEDEFYGVIDGALRDHLPEWIKTSSCVYWLDQPEAQKNLKTYEEVSVFFLEKGISRSSTIIAIGGGATTDLAGFVAATILRGVCWMAIPTTLLAMVDGSIGGKVAVNTAQGKNLLGSFHAPSSVLICHDFLSTLPEAELHSGMGEILKYGFLSKEISDLILNKTPLDVIAFECAHFKSQVVEKDFKDLNERALLNLGHTLGHAFESTLKVSHGMAVAMGLRYLFELFSLQESLDNWNKMALSLNLPFDQLDLKFYKNFSLVQFTEFLKMDKKKTHQSIKLILVKEMGECFIHEIAFNDLLKKIEEHEAFN